MCGPVVSLGALKPSVGDGTESSWPLVHTSRFSAIFFFSFLFFMYCTLSGVYINNNNNNNNGQQSVYQPPVDAIHFLLPNSGQPPNSGQRTSLSLVHQTTLSNRSAPPNNGQVGGAHVGGVENTEDRRSPPVPRERVPLPHFVFVR